MPGSSSATGSPVGSSDASRDSAVNVTSSSGGGGGGGGGGGISADDDDGRYDAEGTRTTSSAADGNDEAVARGASSNLPPLGPGPLSATRDRSGLVRQPVEDYERADASSTSSSSYAERCRELGIAPSPAVDVAVRAATNAGCLTLRGVSIGARGLTALCRALADEFGGAAAAAAASSPSPQRLLQHHHTTSPSSSPQHHRGIGARASGADDEDAPRPQHRPLRSVIVSNCYLGDGGCTELCATLASIFASGDALDGERGQVLTDIDLSGNGIRDATPIADLVSRCAAAADHLASVNLEWNKMGNCVSTMRLLLQNLGTCRSLTQLNLSNNLLPPTAVEGAAHFIAEAPTLMSLNLAWNALGASAGAHLVSGLQRSNSLTTLELNGNGLHRGDLEAVAARVAANERTQAAALAAERQARATEEQLTRLTDELTAAREELARSEVACRELQRETEVAKGRAEAADERADRVCREADGRVARLAEQSEEAIAAAAQARTQAMEQASDASARVVKACERADQQRIDADGAMEALRNEIKELRRNLANAESETSRLSASSSSSKQTAAQVREELDEVRAELTALKASRTELEAAKLAAEDRATRAVADVATVRDELQTVRTQLVEATAQQRSAEATVRDLRSEIDDVKREHARATASLQKTHDEALRAATHENDRAIQRQRDATAAAERRAEDLEGSMRNASAEIARLKGDVEAAKEAAAAKETEFDHERAQLKQDIAMAKADAGRAEAARAAAEARVRAVREDSTRQLEEHATRLSNAISELVDAKAAAAGGGTAGGEDVAALKVRVQSMQRELDESKEANRKLRGKMHAQTKDLEARMLEGVRSAIRGGGGSDS